VNTQIAALCQLGKTVPQVAARVLKESAIAAPAAGTFLSKAFGFSVTDAAAVLNSAGFSATEIASAPLGSFGQTALEGAQLLKAGLRDERHRCRAEDRLQPDRCCVSGHPADPQSRRERDRDGDEGCVSARRRGDGNDPEGPGVRRQCGRRRAAGVYFLTDALAAGGLLTAGFVASEVITALEDVFGDTLDEIGDIADSIGRALGDAISGALCDVFGIFC
jgi:hypothetical protein